MAMICQSSRPGSAFLLRTLAAVACMLLVYVVSAPQPVLADDDRLISSVSSAEISTPKKTLAGLYLHAEDARRFLEAYSDIVLIDVRPSKFVQMRSLAIAHAHLPILLPVEHVESGTIGKGGRRGLAVDADGVPLPSMLVNPGFVEHVRGLLAERGKDPATGTIFVFCGRGMFSARAADLLTEAGFRNVYAIIDSFKS